mgnify:CR=1 FL=1
MCSKNGVELLLLPPHTTHALQPLDVSIFKPLKVFYNQHATAWQHGNPDKVISKVVFGGIFKKAWNDAAKVGNAVKGFEKTGIFPLNSNAIPENKFLSLHLQEESQISPTANTDQPSTASAEIRKLIASPQKSETPQRQRKGSMNLRVTSPENLNLLREKQKSKINGQGQSTESARKRSRYATSAASTSGANREISEDACNFCSIKYSDPKNSKMGSWIQCQKCYMWYHECCVNTYGKKQFTCGLSLYK